MAATFDSHQFNHCWRTALDGLVCLSPIDVDELDLAIFGSQQDEVGLQDRRSQGADHGVVLDDSLQV
jgi:hypothetical protein